MALPLIWLGLGIGALVAGQKLDKSRHRNHVQHFPGEISHPVAPLNGSVVCCGIYGVFDHSGIWLEGNIIERAGNGLVRAISPERFLARRSGERIFVLCDEAGEPLGNEQAAQRAAGQIFQYADYHLLRNNCHQFVWSCLGHHREPVVLFSELNRLLAGHYQTRLSWHPAQYRAI
ncbi:C40 family peptidase [Bowmanella dokdonensis]|uniref:LRAT domain-containing protein n=1 Tax=Bowmanella dokdonensis TaxID=751969 RepID=A0A939DKP9_9ALTE|nr:hypothetical protein [Bowmanella dokdonensis]MBN7824509.1 hypothetical protein [Bowmanella dokdonensis]